jgi:molybdopterin-guanine dinucleotide biosynthesis protein A
MDCCMKYNCTGVILAGGLGTRFDGKNKALLQIRGKTILQYIYEVYEALFDEIILVTNNPLEYLDWDLEIVTDIFSIRSSMTGIHAGLFYAGHPYAFVTACDTPFVKKQLVETVLAGINGNTEWIIPRTSLGMEPMCAVYSKQCLQNMETCLRNKKFKIQKCLRKVPTKIISEKKLLEIDPELISFFNINTPEDLCRAEAMVQRGLS